MQFDPSILIPVIPEIFVASMACLILVVDLFLGDEQRIVTYGLTQVTLVGAECALREQPDRQAAESLGFAVHLRLRISEQSEQGEGSEVGYAGIRGWVHASGLLAWCRAYGPDDSVVWAGAAAPRRQP